MSFNWIEESLFSIAAAGLGEYAAITHWPNNKFSPQNLEAWVKIVNVPTSEYPVTMGIDGDNECVGFLQLSVYAKAGTGSKTASKIIDDINKLFKIPYKLNTPPGSILRLTNKGFSQGGQTSLADTSAGGIEGLWDSNYITVYWLARGPR